MSLRDGAGPVDCYVCRGNDRIDELPVRELVAADAHWRVAHAFNTTLPGWLVLAPRRHVTAIAELTDAEAATLGGWQVRLSRALHDVTGCEKTYLMQFAEQEGFAHVHFHLVPRMPDLATDHRGPAVFHHLTRQPGQGIDEQRRDEVAMALRASLDRVEPAADAGPDRPSPSTGTGTGTGTGTTASDRPPVRVNQVGYLPDAPKFATWVTGVDGTMPFTVHARDGSVMLRGTSTPWPVRPEPTSGQSLQLLDLTALTTVGDGYRIEVDGDRSHPFRIGPDLYDRLGRDALGLFYLLRSGTPIEDRRAPGQARPAGHAGVPPNQGDIAVPGWSGPDAARLYPGWHPTGVFNVSGGWYDAGDYGKYAVSGAIALWQLLHLVRLLRHQPHPRRAGGVSEPELVEECRWQLDWLLRMQVPPGQPYAGMAFHRVHGTQWSPMPGRAHEDPTMRVLHRPSTAATLHLAAVAAQGARLLADDDPGYAAQLLTAARTAYRAAQAYPDLLAPDDEGSHGGGPYDDARVADDFYWAAVQLWLATGEDGYRADVCGSPEHTADVFDPGGFDFNAVSGPARLDLVTATPRLPDHDRVVGSVLAAAERLLDLQHRQPWGQPYAPAEGWAWGSNGRILNNLVVLAIAHELTGDRRWRNAVAGGVDYLLGRNALGQCYVTGYGTDSSRHLRTRQFGHDLDPSLPAPPPGALAGGANSTHTAGFPTDPRLDGLPPQLRYLDVPTSETTNDICIRWNAPLTYIAAYLSLTAPQDPPPPAREQRLTGRS